MSSYEEKLLALDTRRKALLAKELEIAAERERLAIEQQQLDAQKLIDMHGLTDRQIAHFRTAVTCIVKTICADGVPHAGLTVVDEEPNDPDDKPYSIHMACCYSTYDIPGMTFDVIIKTQNQAIVALLRSMIKQISPYEDDESKRMSWRVYWDDYETIKLNE
jgi:hypothetical protein